MKVSRVALVMRLAFLYFAAVFFVGFLLGAARALWIAPRIGERPAEPRRAARDPVSGFAYVLALLLFAPMPAVIARRRSRR